MGRGAPQTRPWPQHGKRMVRRANRDFILHRRAATIGLLMTACVLLMTACAQPPPGGGGMVLPTSGDDGPAVLDGGQTVADAGSANGDTTGSDVAVDTRPMWPSISVCVIRPMSGSAQLAAAAA